MVEEVEKSLHEMKCPLVPQLGWVLSPSYDQV